METAIIVTELVTNAVKHARGNITVRIGGTPAAGYSLSVLDDGPGIYRDLIPRTPKVLE
jgi:two-component sensor histidine kinase